MKTTAPAFRLTSVVLCLLALGASGQAPHGSGAVSQSPSEMKLLAPADFAAQWHGGQTPAATVIYVGFPVLYKGAHIRNAILAGPASKPEGIEALSRALDKVPRDARIVLYCGCCTWEHCPNIRPAYKLARDRGFLHVEALKIDVNLHTDWIVPGYPTEKPSGR